MPQISDYSASADFFLGLFFEHKDGGHMSLPNVWLSMNHPALQPEDRSVH
jgi:hypothetical protein